MKAQGYRFAFADSNLVLPDGIEAWLQDNYLDTSIRITLADGDTTFVNFNVTSASASKGPPAPRGRYRLLGSPDRRLDGCYSNPRRWRGP